MTKLIHTGNLSVRNLQREYKKLMSVSPKKKSRCYVWDKSIPGLGVRILNPSGTMTAIYRSRQYEGNGSSNSVEKMICRISMTAESLQQAIDIAASWYEKRAVGYDTTRVLKLPSTVEKFYRDVYFIEHQDKCLDGSQKAPKSIQRDGQIANKLIEHVGWMDLKDPEIYDAFIRWRHEVVEAGTGYQTMKKAAQLMRRLFRMGIRRGVCSHDFLSDFKIPNHQPRNMHVPPEEVAAIYKACLQYKATSGRKWTRIADMFILKILLGTRSGEMVDLRKSEVDLDKAVIIMDPSRTKTRKSYRFKLTEMAVDLLRNTEAMSEPDNPLMFGIKGNSCTAYLMEWHRILDITGLYNTLPQGTWEQQTPAERIFTSEVKEKRPRPHDLRHAFITNAREAGISREDVALAAQHSNTNTTELYEHVTDEIKSKVISAREASLVTALNQ